MSRSRAANARSRTRIALLAEQRRGDRAVPELSLDADRPAARARRRPRDERRLALRPRARGARDQAGARRSDRGDLPAARLSHHLAALRLRPSRSTPAAMHGAPAHLRDLQGSAGRPGARARPSTTPTGCWISRSTRAAIRRRRRRPHRRTLAGADAARHRHPRRRRSDRADAAGDADAPVGDLTREPLDFPAERDAARCRIWRAATKAFCWRSAIPPSAAMAATIRSPARSASARSRSRSSPEELGFAVRSATSP